MDWMPQAVRDGIVVVLVISGPLVLTAAFIGLVIGILQAATQVQEQTIGSALKIIGVFALIIFAGFWMFQYLNQYTLRTLSSAFTFIPKQTQKAVPSDAFDDEKFNATFIEEAGKVEQLKVLEPEKLEVEDLPKAPIPAGVPYLGAPELPKLPKITKIEPPSLPEVPKLPVEMKPQEELKTISPITVPESSKDITDKASEVEFVEEDIEVKRDLATPTSTPVQEEVLQEQKLQEGETGEGNVGTWLEQ